MVVKNSDLFYGINHSFISLPKNLWDASFFPSLEWYFTVLTDDKVVFMCSRKDVDGKGIYCVSWESRASLGRYFKKRHVTAILLYFCPPKSCDASRISIPTGFFSLS